MGPVGALLRPGTGHGAERLADRRADRAPWDITELSGHAALKRGLGVQYVCLGAPLDADTVLTGEITTGSANRPLAGRWLEGSS